MAEPIVADACLLLNLLATGHVEEILDACCLVLVTSPEVAGEALYLVGPTMEDGSPSQESVDVSALTKGGLLSLRSIGVKAADLKVALAAHLRDPDASLVALAATLGLPLATDDKKIRKVTARVLPEQKMMRTLGLIRSAATRLNWNSAKTTALLKGLRLRGNFDPPLDDPDRDWYANALGNSAESTEIGYETEVTSGSGGDQRRGRRWASCISNPRAKAT